MRQNLVLSAVSEEAVTDVRPELRAPSKKAQPWKQKRNVKKSNFYTKSEGNEGKGRIRGEVKEDQKTGGKKLLKKV